jgi:hypothetical protein
MSNICPAPIPQRTPTDLEIVLRTFFVEHPTLPGRLYSPELDRIRQEMLGRTSTEAA